jgi:hypothetical protein
VKQTVTRLGSRPGERERCAAVGDEFAGGRSTEADKITRVCGW